MKRLPRLFAFMVLVAVGINAGNTSAQSYPTKPIRIVVPVAPGGSIDITARVIAQGLSRIWKQPVLIDNRPGAAETIGANMVAKAAPDGYSLLVSSSLAITPALRKLPYDVATDFMPVTQLVASPQLLVVGSALSVASVKELIALVKAKSRPLNVGHAGVGSPLHLEIEHFKLAANIANEGLIGVPYKGAALLTNALVAGEVDMAVLPLAIGLPSIKAGRLRALGIFGARRLVTLPEVPTLAEAGVIGLETDIWNGLFAPAKTPRDIVGFVQQTVAKVLNMPDVRDQLLGMGQVLVGNTPEEFDARFKADLVTFAKIVKDARIPLQD